MSFHPADSGAHAPSGCPAHARRVALYDDDFTANPARTYASLRRYGRVAPVDIAPGVRATLVISYPAALEILRNTKVFRRDSRRWQGRVPQGGPALRTLGYRPNCRFSDGGAHTRLRGALNDAVRRTTASIVRDRVESVADRLIAEFGPTGRADLLDQYARVLPLTVLNELLGCSSEIGARVREHLTNGLTSVDPERSDAELRRTLGELVTHKRAHPGNDMASWLIAHPARLTDEELYQQLTVLLSTGSEPEQNLIANALRLLLSDQRFAGDPSGGGTPIENALDEVLWTDPPLANHGVTYPIQDVHMGNVVLPEAEPVVISFAAANTDPALASQERVGNRAHLAWGAGPHACPAQDMARQIASTAIERLLDALPEIEIAAPPERLRWRRDPFHRALVALPVRFPPLVAASEAPPRTSWNADDAVPSSSTESGPAATPQPTGTDHARPPWLDSLARWWRGQ